MSAQRLTPLADHVRAHGWQDEAACIGQDPELFWPANISFEYGAERWYTAAVRACIAICHGCPVRRECLSHALSWPESFGLWGGLLPEQRRGKTVDDLDELLEYG